MKWVQGFWTLSAAWSPASSCWNPTPAAGGGSPQGSAAYLWEANCLQQTMHFLRTTGTRQWYLRKALLFSYSYRPYVRKKSSSIETSLLPCTFPLATSTAVWGPSSLVVAAFVIHHKTNRESIMQIYNYCLVFCISIVFFWKLNCIDVDEKMWWDLQLLPSLIDRKIVSETSEGDFCLLHDVIEEHMDWVPGNCGIIIRITVQTCNTLC